MKTWLLALSSVAVINMTGLSIVLIIKKIRSKKNWLIAAILILPAYSIFLASIRYAGLFTNYSFLIALDYILIYLWPPIILFYVRIMTGQKIYFRLKTFLHFLPSFLVLCFMLTLLLKTEWTYLLNNIQTKQGSLFTDFLEIPFVIQALAYLFYCRKKVLNHNQSVKKSTDKIHPVSLRWLQTLIQGLIVIILIVSIAAIFFPFIEYFLFFMSIASIIPYFYLFFKLLSSEHLYSEKDHDFLKSFYIPQKKELLSSFPEKKIQIKTSDTQFFIDIASILYIRSEEKYTRVYLADHSYLSDYTLIELEKKFPEDLLRIHRNSLVNIHHVSNIEKIPGGKIFLVMADKEKLEVSRRMAESVKVVFSS